MITKKAKPISKYIEVSEEEKETARKAILAFDEFVKRLWAARKKDKKLVNVLKENQEGEGSSSLFDIRHLLRKFQREVKQRYSSIIVSFAGKKNFENDQVSTGYIHTLNSLINDTTTRNIKNALQNSFQQLTEFVEDFLEAFEDFHDPNQVQKIIEASDKADSIVDTIENIVDNQLKPHFEKNILISNRVASIRNNIKYRTRIIKYMAGE